MLQAESQAPEVPAIEVQMPSRRSLRPLEAFQGSLAQRVYASLREAILSMSYRPGDIIRKPDRKSVV